MIIKMFNQGKHTADNLVSYLFDEKKHPNSKPELVKGNAFLTQSIVNSITRKNKFTTGVISFREGEYLSHAEQLKLIHEFERTFAPFKEESRSNFLWIRHNEHNRIELHFVNPMQDMKTGKSFNISPPGKSNQLFYREFQAMKNCEYGFKQVDKENYSRKNYAFSSKVVDDMCGKRIDYIISKFDKPNLTRKFNNNNIGVNKNGKSRKAITNNGDDNTKSSIRIDGAKHEIKFDRVNIKSSATKPDIGAVVNNPASRASSSHFEDTQFGLRIDHSTTQARKSRLQAQVSLTDQGSDWNDAKALGSLEDSIRALSMQLLTCPPEQKANLIARLGALILQKQQQALAQAERRKKLKIGK
jgi:hypothetical protein